MARDGIMAPLGVRAAAIFKLLTDVSGGSTTYDTGVDFTIQNINLNPDFITAALPGNDRILDRYSKIRSIQGSVTKAKLSLPVIAILMGATTTDSGSTPNEKRQVRITGSQSTAYFKIDAQVRYLGEDDTAGDYHIVLHKCKVTSWSMGHTQDGYAECSFEFEAIPTLAGDILVDFEQNETAVAISTSVDTTPPTVSSRNVSDGATSVPVDTNIVWTFSEPIQFDASAFELYQVVSTTNRTRVAATVTFNGSTVVTLNPDSNLSAASNYVALAATNVRDLAGNRLAAPDIIDFVTA